MPINHTSSNPTQARSKAVGTRPETAETRFVARAKNTLRDPLTIVLLVWALMFAAAGVCWLFYS